MIKYHNCNKKIIRMYDKILVCWITTFQISYIDPFSRIGYCPKTQKNEKKRKNQRER